MPRSRGIIAVALSSGLAGLGLGFAPALGPSPAEAQLWWNAPQPSYYRPRVNLDRARVPRRDVNRVSRRPKPSAEEVAASKTTASGPLLAVVSIGNQRMTVYDSSGAIIRSPVSTGKAGHRTPTGVFSVIQKNRHHVSNIYSGAPMPYMQRITWSGIALHAGVLPGYPASGGCIRLPFPVAAKLFAISRMSMRVIVAPHEPTPSAFTHPALPEPVMVAVPAGSPQDQRATGDAAAPMRIATAGGAAQGAGDQNAAVASRFLNPMQYAQAERVRARERVAEAIKANRELLEASLRASAEANAAIAALRAAQAAYDGLRARLGSAAGGEQLAEAERNLAQSKATEAAKSTAAFAAARASRDAEDAQAKAETDAKVAERATEPIAVLISRKEGKVLVRQGLVPLFEAPVTFKDPGRPLGTHVFQAMSADTSTGRIGWTVVTVPESVGGSAESLENRGPVRRGERIAPVSLGPPSDAKGALERVEMAPDVKKRIAARLWLNGSIVVSDHGLGTETGKGTDFIVQTR